MIQVYTNAYTENKAVLRERTENCEQFCEYVSHQIRYQEPS